MLALCVENPAQRISNVASVSFAWSWLCYISDHMQMMSIYFLVSRSSNKHGAEGMALLPGVYVQMVTFSQGNSDLDWL